MRMKKWLSLSLALILLFGLSACAKPVEKTADKSETALETQAADEKVTEKETEAVTGAVKSSGESENASDKSPDEAERAAAFLVSLGGRVSVQAGTVGDFLAQDIVGGEAVDAYDKYVDAITALKQKKVNAAVMDEGPAKKIIALNDDLGIFPDALTEENYAFAVKKGKTELLDAMNKTLAELKASGELSKIFDKYIADEEGAGDGIDFNEGAKGGKLIMGTESGFAPYEMKKGEQFSGIDIEIMALIAKALDKELVVEDMQFASLIPAVNSGKIDVIAAGLTVTDERKESVDFSDEYVSGAKQVAVVRKVDLP